MRRPVSRVERLEPRKLMAAAPSTGGELNLSPLGTYATGVFNQGAAEIVAYDAGTKRLFSVNANAGTVDILDASDPGNPTKIRTLTLGEDESPTSVAVRFCLVAVALHAAVKQDPGRVAFFNTDGAPLASVTAGALPDMITFTPDGRRVLIANEGEPSGDYQNDPEGSVTIVDLPRYAPGGGNGNGDGNGNSRPRLLTSLDVGQGDVRTASFGAFNDDKAALLAAGVRIYGPNAAGTGTTAVAQDLEPEYIAVARDSKTAYVTLQENNAYAVIDLRSGQVREIIPFGYKDYSAPTAALDTFTFNNLPVLDQTEAGQDIPLGGFSGLLFDGYTRDGSLRFITHTDRGPNAEPTGILRPFLLPDFNPEIIRFELNPSTGRLTLTDRTPLRRQNNKPLTGLPNTALGPNANAPYNDEVPVDLFGNVLPPDALGGDFEGIARDDRNGTFWMVDEYRPAIYHFNKQGKLIERYVPIGTAAAAGRPAGTFGKEVLPAVLAQRRQNRGFEAVAFQDGKVLAFVQSPLRNPTDLSNATLNGLRNVRVVEFDPKTLATRQFVYVMDNLNLGGDPNSRADKIGDATAIGGGEFLVVERDDDAIDSDPRAVIEKKVYRFSLAGATDLSNLPNVINGKTVDQMTPAELAAAGVTPIGKTLHVDLNDVGYNTVEKVEGLAFLGDGTIAVVNDNDFTVANITVDQATGTFTRNAPGEPVVLGIVRTHSNGLDPSDRDSRINIGPQRVLGMYQPDAIAAYTVGGETYLVTANEGDAREYAAFAEEARVSSLRLDPAAFPDAAVLRLNANLGRLNVTKALGDTDGDGDYDKLYTLGGRSFSIFRADGTLVFDSGDDFERVTARAHPEFFNASNTSNAFDDRSDNKGPEPEGVTLGEINGRTYAFIALERIGGIMVYDVTDPRSVRFVTYTNNRNFTAAPESPEAKDLGPEGLSFIPADRSPTGRPMLAVANEVSGTVTLFDVRTRGDDEGEGEDEEYED